MPSKFNAFVNEDVPVRRNPTPNTFIKPILVLTNQNRFAHITIAFRSFSQYSPSNSSFSASSS